MIDCLWRLTVLAGPLGPLGPVPAAPSGRLWLWLSRWRWLWPSMLGRSDQGPKSPRLLTSSSHCQNLFFSSALNHRVRPPSLRLRILASAESSIAVLLRFGAAVLLPVPVPTPASSLFSPQGLPATPRPRSRIPYILLEHQPTASSLRPRQPSRSRRVVEKANRITRSTSKASRSAALYCPFPRLGPTFGATRRRPPTPFQSLLVRLQPNPWPPCSRQSGFPCGIREYTRNENRVTGDSDQLPIPPFVRPSTA